jgi:hypothetical protein
MVRTRMAATRLIGLVGRSADQLLCACPDGAGDMQCVHRAEPAGRCVPQRVVCDGQAGAHPDRDLREEGLEES